MLINNAGVLGLPLTRTADGFEAHMGTNYLGHFALTCLLGDRIKDRVISVVSSAYAMSRVHIEDLNWNNREYSPWLAYGESKLAVMLFNHELTRRGARTYLTDPGATNADITRDASGLVPWIRDHTFRGYSGAHRGYRRSVDPSCGHHRPAQRDLPCSAVQPVAQTHRHQAPCQGARHRDGTPPLATSVELTGCDWPV